MKYVIISEEASPFVKVYIWCKWIFFIGSLILGALVVFLEFPIDSVWEKGLLVMTKAFVSLAFVPLLLPNATYKNVRTLYIESEYISIVKEGTAHHYFWNDIEHITLEKIAKGYHYLKINEIKLPLKLSEVQLEEIEVYLKTRINI